MKTNQKGIAVVAVILLVVLVGLVGATGWYVYNSNNKTNESLTNAQNSVNNAADAAKKANDNKKAATPTPSATPDTQKYLVIKEWNVKVPLTDKIADATYIVTNGTVYLSTQSLTNKYPECAADKTTVFAYGRYDNPDAETIGGMTIGETTPNAPKVGGYYYFGVPPQAGCIDDPNLVDSGYNSLSEYRNAFNDAIKNVKAN